MLDYCLAVTVRPLHVDELAEIFTFDFNETQGGIPKFHAERRPNDQEEAVLSTCSSLISVVSNGRSSVVQFSHLSVKEFLTSTHLASSTGDLSLYHILPEHAHTILAQVCLGLLLHLDDRNYNKSAWASPLAQYAAQHWVAHAQFGDVASRVRDGMESLFDPDKPHLSAWISRYDIVEESELRSLSVKPTPLYYSALYGFRDLVQHLVIKHPHHVNAIGGSERFPLFAALFRNHIKIMEILLKHGGNVDVRDAREQTALHKTIYQKDEAAIEAMQVLLGHGADVNARRDDLWTPLHLAVYDGTLTMVQMLLDNQADVNSRDDDGQAPLHLLSRRATFQDEDTYMAKLLLERGAKVNAQDKNHNTPLHLARNWGKFEIARLLLDRGATLNAGVDNGETQPSSKVLSETNSEVRMPILSLLIGLTFPS